MLLHGNCALIEQSAERRHSMEKNCRLLPRIFARECTGKITRNVLITTIKLNVPQFINTIRIVFITNYILAGDFLACAVDNVKKISLAPLVLFHRLIL